MPIDPNKEATRRRLQNEMLMLDSDLKKKVRKKADLEMEKKRIKLGLDRIQIELAAKEREAKKLDQEIFLINNDLASLKKKINAL